MKKATHTLHKSFLAHRPSGTIVFYDENIYFYEDDLSYKKLCKYLKYENIAMKPFNT